MKEPNWKKLKEIAQKSAALRASGQWSKAAFLQLFREGKQATDGDATFLEFLINKAKPEWLEGLL